MFLWQPLSLLNEAFCSVADSYSSDTSEDSWGTSEVRRNVPRGGFHSHVFCQNSWCQHGKTVQVHWHCFLYIGYLQLTFMIIKKHFVVHILGLYSRHCGFLAGVDSSHCFCDCAYHYHFYIGCARMWQVSIWLREREREMAMTKHFYINIKKSLMIINNL